MRLNGVLFRAKGAGRGSERPKDCGDLLVLVSSTPKLLLATVRTDEDASRLLEYDQLRFDFG